MYTLKKEKEYERRRARVTDVFYAKQEEKNKLQMTRISSGRNIRFMYIYMLISDQLRRKKKKNEEILNLLSHHLHQENKHLALYFDV
jgi:hypothetical protein